MLTTLLPPTAGTARVAGHDIVREGPAVRAAIGAALQEAALDPLLTGREHMRLQTTLQGLPKAERARARRRAARARRADRRGRPQGRRLLGRHEAPARPRARARAPPARPVPRRADHRASTRRAAPTCGQEVARLAREDGVTVFLTTQYLEEADVLADRVGIIDHGQDRRRGHAGGAEGRDRAPDARGRCRPSADDRDARRRRARRASATPVAAPPGAAAVRLERRRRRARRRSCARSTPRTSRSPTSSCTSRRSTTSSSPRPAASSTGDEAAAEPEAVPA